MSMSLLRRGPHLKPNLKARVQKLEKKQEHFKKCEKYLETALAELTAAKTQIAELNAAMNYLFDQHPHNGLYRDRVSINSSCMYLDNSKC